VSARSVEAEGLALLVVGMALVASWRRRGGEGNVVGRSGSSVALAGAFLYNAWTRAIP